MRPRQAENSAVLQTYLCQLATVSVFDSCCLCANFDDSCVGDTPGRGSSMKKLLVDAAGQDSAVDDDGVSVREGGSIAGKINRRAD